MLGRRRVADGAGDGRGVGTDEVHPDHGPAELAEQEREVLALPLPTQDQVDAGRRVARQGGQGGAHVGGLGVVHPAHVADLGHGAMPVRQTGERTQRAHHGVASGAQLARRQRGGESVGLVVQAGEGHLVGGGEHLVAKLELAAVQPGLGRTVDGEKQPPGPGRGVPDRRVIGVEHGGVADLLEGEEPLLGTSVGLQVGMPLQVVLAQVEEDGDARPHGGQQLGLEGGDLQNPGVPRRGHHQRRRRRSQVAAGHRRDAGGAYHLGHQHGHGALAIGPGHRHQGRAGTMTPGELHLGEHRHSEAAGPLQERRVRGDARARDHRLDPLEAGFGMAAEEGRDAGGELLEGGRQLVRRPAVGDSHLASPGRRQARRGQPGGPEPDHEQR